MLMIESNNFNNFYVDRKFNSRILLSDINIDIYNYFDDIQLNYDISQLIYKYSTKIIDIVSIKYVTKSQVITDQNFIENMLWYDYNFKVLYDHFMYEALSVHHQQDIDIPDHIHNTFLNTICFVCSNNIRIYKNKLLTVIMETDFLLFYGNLFHNLIFMNFKTRTQTYIDRNITIKIKYMKERKTVCGFIKKHEFLNLISVSFDNNNDIITKYNYDNHSSIKINSQTIDKQNGDYIETYNKNGCLIEKKYNHETDTLNIISQCMISDNSNGLRYRGKFTFETQNGSIKNKTITINDNVVYDENNEGNILVDKLERLVIKENDFIIGWKVVKSINGEKRILKLGIDCDATIIRPINEEIFISHGKERCNRAIVMDIQLYEENEISVVPNETKAYSYVYNENNFEYKIGEQIVPDSFNNNHNICCTNGIHYFPNRKSIFLSKY